MFGVIQILHDLKFSLKKLYKLQDTKFLQHYEVVVRYIGHSIQQKKSIDKKSIFGHNISHLARYLAESYLKHHR